MSDHDLDLDDWIDLLEVREDLDALLEGRASIDMTYTALADARGRYPGALGDYVVALDAVRAFVDRVGDAIDHQNTRLDAFAEAIAEAGLRFSWDRRRLIDDGERAEIARIERELEALAARADAAAEEAEDGIEELQDRIDALEEQLAALEQQESNLQAQIADLEEQLAQAEEGDEG